MKIVIDIAEETYVNVKSKGLFLCPRDKNELEKAIKCAIPYEERHKGYWDKINHGDYESPDIAIRCSECLEEVDEESNFCPYCGADMRGGTE